MRNNLKCNILFVLVALCLCGCSREKKYLRYALNAAGGNRTELEAVLEHYRTADPDHEKLAAAEFLISNMPAHYSYRSDKIEGYYKTALEILKSGKDPASQNDTLLEITDRDYGEMDYDLISDIKIMTSRYLIKSIDQAFEEWRTRPWASHLTFDEFCEWLLPYKLIETQSLDSWRDTLSAHFTDSLSRWSSDAANYGTIFAAQDMVRNEILGKVKPYGIYTRSGLPMLSASVLPYQTFGRCIDYVTLGVLTYRSAGIPAVIDETPCWGRYRAGHSWYTILSDQGRELASEWDMGSVPGWGFFPYERIPKVFRNTYAINRERTAYRNNAKYVHPFDVCQQDMTDRYYKTSDLELTLLDGVAGKLQDTYVYISVFNGHAEDWSVVDYGTLRRGKACFTRMGRNVLYMAQGYDGDGLIPITAPFILQKDGLVRYIHSDTNRLRSVDVHRKYYQNANVVNMRRRLLGGRIQASDSPDFKNAVTLYTIANTTIPDKIPLETTTPYRYWRYLSPDGSYGSMAELAFFNEDTARMDGKKPIGSTADAGVLMRAFDSDWLTNFETDEPDGNWIGVDMGEPSVVSYVRVVPRSDDNDIHPGETYEFRYMNPQGGWVSRDAVTATDNVLHYDSVPAGALMWVRDLTRGWDERVFLIDDDGNPEWW